MNAPACAAEVRTGKRDGLGVYQPVEGEQTRPVWLARGGSLTLSVNVDGRKIRQRIVPGANAMPVSMLEALAADADFRTHIELGHVVLDVPEPTLTWVNRAIAAIECLYQDNGAPARASAMFCRELLGKYLAVGRRDPSVRQRAEHVLKTLDRVEAARARS